MINRTFDQWCRDIDKRPALAVMFSVLWVLLVCGIAFWWHLGSTGLVDETEPLFAEASRQMLVRGDWITPFFNDDTRFDKPALIYWCQAIAYAMIGVNEWAVRLPSAMAATGVAGLSFYTLHWYFSKQDELKGTSRPTHRWIIAGLGAAMVALNPEMIVWGRTGVSDMLLTGCIASSLLCFFLGYANQENKVKDEQKNSLFPSGWYCAFYILIGAGILTKGPVGIVLPGLIIGAFLVYVGKFWEVLREIRIFVGLLIIATVSLPWYLLVTWRNGWNFINAFFGYHNVERFTAVVNRHSAPWYFYFLVVLLGFAPYSVYLPSAMARLKFWQRKYWCSVSRVQQFSLFNFFWFAVIFGFFTVAVTKLPSYVLPLMPAAAILIALMCDDFLSGGGKDGMEGVNEINQEQKTFTSSLPPFFRASAWVNIIFVSAIGFTLFYVPKLIGPDPAAPTFSQDLQQSGVTVVGGIIWLVCAVVLGFLLTQQRWFSLFGMNLTALALFLIFVLTPALFIMDSTRQLPLRQLAAIAVQNKQPNEELIMIGFKKPTVVFYTHFTVNYIRASETAGQYIQNQISQKTRPSALILSEPKKISEMGLQPTSYKILGDHGAYQLIRVPFGR